MGCFKKKKAASSLAPSDKYHRNPQGGHRNTTQSSTLSGGGGETNTDGTTTSNNNGQFSHNEITPAREGLQQDLDQVDHHHQQLHQNHHQLINHSPYQFYPPSSLGSASITSSSHQFHPLAHGNHHHPHQPPHLLYKSNHSSSGSGGSSGNGSHIIIDGSTTNGPVEGSSNKYYYYNSLYYPTEEQEGEEDPDQIFTLNSTPTGTPRASREVSMGRVGEDVYPPGSPASVGSGIGSGGGSSGLFKSKSGSIPVTSSGHTRGFRDTFISSMSPPIHAHSAESSPLHRSASAVTANKDHDNRFISSANNISGGKQENNKKWTFGGLFRRNKKAGAPLSTSNNNSIVENGAGSSATNYNSNSHSPAKFNNNYGSGSSRVTPSPAPSSSIGVVNIDPSAGGGVGGGERENSNSHRTSTPKFVNAEVQTRAKGKLSESDISTCDSDFELAHPSHENPPEPAPQEGKGGGYKQNFLVRRLSRRREKAAAKKKAAAEATSGASTSASNLHNNNSSTNGFVSSQHGHLDVPQMKRRVGSSPDSLNNSEPWPSWETTKKPQTQLHVLQQEQHHLQNHSSNGSLSLSQEGSNSNTNHLSNGSKSSKVAAKEAVKARAIARRESFLRDSSTSDDDDTEERSRSSLQGSFSSLNSRNRRQKAFNMQQAQFQQQRHLFPTAGGGMSCASPSSPMPVPLDYRNSMSPNMNRRLMMMGGGAPGSPKWEARVIYQQENISENNQPVVFRLPRKERNPGNGASTNTPPKTMTSSNPNQMSQNNGDQSFIMATEMISEDQHVVTAGLKVPFMGGPTQPTQQSPHHHAYQQQDQQCFRNGQLMYPDDPVQYANVPNGMRGRSSTPYTFNNVNAGSGAIHHASPTPPPPPPPRRDFTRASNASANNPNFYRPVSCSYLDAYASQLHHMSEQQQMMRQQSPMIFNGNYIYPSPQQMHHQYQQGHHELMTNGFASHSATPLHNFESSPAVRASPRHVTGNYTNASPPEVENLRHPPLIRSPSEPPAIRIEQVRSSNSPVKRLLSSPMPNGDEIDPRKSSQSKSAITSKLGYPVRRLQEVSKLTGPQSPVHLKASEFWRKKESEVTGTSPVGNNQKKYLNRIRSADSSPLPVPKMRKSPGVIAVSNESISSLSSFSENAASPGPPKNSSSPINPMSKPGGSNLAAVKVTPIRARLSKTPNPQQLTYGNNTKDKENNNGTSQQQSAVERLKVRIPSAPDGALKGASNPLPGLSSSFSENNNNPRKLESTSNPIRALIELNNGKTPGKNLEDALNELEDMYKSLRLSDEDLLDRAERRDLPTPHQELRDAPLIPLPQGYRFEHLGSVESLGTGSGSSGTNYTGHSGDNHIPRVRAPPVRRSSRPDTVTDDMANRRLACPDDKPMDPRVLVAKNGSYLAKAPAFSPCTSPCPQDVSSYPLAFLGQDDPDLTLDDVSFRNYKRANSVRIIDPQPLFGIPLGPITSSIATDYLHLKPTESYRPIFGHLKNPDVVNDDIAFRNLRKDLGHQDSSPSTPKDWTPRLFSPTRESSFNYPSAKDSKKLRAIRSLSANITHMIPTNGSGTSGARDSPTSCYQQYNRDIGKWSSYSDLHRRASAGSPARASTYLQPSWVEQIEKVQTSTETLTDYRNSAGRLSTAILDPPEHWERKFPKKTVELTPPIYDPCMPRRPWTDIILESFEKEKEREMERLAAEAEAAANEAAVAANNKTGAKSESLEDEEVAGDDDVFMDASAEASKSEALHSPRENQISGNNSKNNDPERMSLQQTRPNMDIASELARPLPLLPGQKTRRGSWVEPTKYARSYSTSSAFHASTLSSSSSNNTGDGNASWEELLQDKRRKSWSDLPKDIDSFSATAIILSGSSCSASPTRKLFNPLPPPKKIRQINLEAFNNNSSSGGNQVEVVKSHSSYTQRAGEDEENSQLTSTSPSSDKVKSPNSKIRGEDELNELMDQLLKDADTCGGQSESSREVVTGECAKSAEKATESSISSSVSPTTDKDKSISTTVNSPNEEMKMDGITSSCEKSCKQDLSCTIVGIIPKHQSAPPSSSQQASSSYPDRNSVRGEEPTFTQQQSITSPLKSSPSPSQLQEDCGGSGSRKVFKIDNNGKGNVDSGSAAVPRDGNEGVENSNSKRIPLSKPFLFEETTKKKGEASSIEDLIESINETLPELEASCGVGIGIRREQDKDGKLHGSSSASGSPASSIPSPSPGSPTPPVLSVSVKKEVTSGGLLSPSAFPVAAKRHHLPTKEESLYENLPVRGKTGNDEKVAQSSPSSQPTSTTGRKHGVEAEQFRNDPPFGLEKNSTVRIPPLTSCREDGHVHDEDDNEEGQHSSSHQPSSLSSNDSEVGVRSPREQERDRATNNIKLNQDQVDQETCSSSSSPVDNKPSCISSSSFDAFTTKPDNSITPTSTNSASTREPLLRKKSEGYEQDDPHKTAISHSKRDSHLDKLSNENENYYEIQKEMLIPMRETYITSSSTTTSSSSSAEEQQQKKKAEMRQPVAPPVTCTFTSATKKSSALIATPSMETSTTETSTGMSFLRNNFPFFRNSTSRSRSQSVVSDISRSSETGDSKKERDKSYRRKSHLNRAFTDEPVPDNNYMFDVTTKSSKPASQEVSSLENSAVEESRGKLAVKLHPAIPSVLTNKKSASPLSKPVTRNNSLNLESTPSPALANNPMSKLQAGEQARKSSPVVKKDSFSDAEGVCFIKKMLQKESDRDRAAAAAAGGNKQNPQNTPYGNNSAAYNIKKSPSVGNQSYWSKFSNSQSAFLRKLFDKPKISESPINLKAPQKSNAENDLVGENGEKDCEKENAEPLKGFSVAQKASFFMKLEHEQRFSKWRKNSVDLGATSLEQNQQQSGNQNIASNNLREFRPRSRYLTQPVTPTEVKELAPLVNLIADNQPRVLEFGSQPRVWGNSFSSLGNRLTDDASEKSSKENPSKAFKSSYKDCDDTHKFEPIVVANSLKERVTKFDEIMVRKIDPTSCSTAPSPTIKSYSLTRSSRNTNTHKDNLGGFPMYHSASAIINPTAAKNVAGVNVRPCGSFYKNPITAYSSSSSSFSEAMSKNESTKFIPVTASLTKKNPPLYENDKRRGSASDLETTAANQSPVINRSEKVRSLYLSRSAYHGDTDNLSEDGEVSSGGQEVAEIICRSYENSPVFRKKNWRSQKQVHSNFTKEIWRRCGNYENWGQKSNTNPQQQPQPPQPLPQTFTSTTNVIEVTTVAPPKLPPVAPSPPPATSNLLQILTTLSSSNDELSDTKSKSKKEHLAHKQSTGSGSDSIPPVHPAHQSNHHPARINTASPNHTISTMGPAPGSEIFVSVPHPEDEAFQSFFCSVKSYSHVTHFPSGMIGVDANSREYGIDNGGIVAPSTSTDVLDISSVRRESDLLVMKKNIPPAKRKSSGKYKNPLRALAARMDFRQQGYTQIHNNTVQCSSDVDVTT